MVKYFSTKQKLQKLTNTRLHYKNIKKSSYIGKARMQALQVQK